jgi:hypothetical protein
MTVFVLGAGASLHAGYPLAAELGNVLRAWINTLSPEHDYQYGMAQVVDLYGSLDNFESILADLMTCPPGSRAASLGAMRPLLLYNLQEAVRDYFDVIRSAPAPLYDELSRHLFPGDKVITFNYDLAFERALHGAGLWDIKSGYGFRIADACQPSPVEVLKLHGSTNWRRVHFGGVTGRSAVDFNSLSDRPVLYIRPDWEYLGYHEAVDSLCSLPNVTYSSPAMIMPALPKYFYFQTSFGQEMKSFWDRLWERAKRELENADELVLIGYSLPTADERARSMLLGTTNKSVRLSICCANATTALEQEFRDNGFDGIQQRACTFENFLKARALTGHCLSR